MMMADSFSTAILFPVAAMRPSLVAEPLIEVVMVENVSDCRTQLATLSPLSLPFPYRPPQT